MIHHGDCLEVMKNFEANSIDSIITDPPYGLSFMGKDWDHGIPGVPYWAEMLRVAKPGAMLLSFGGTRTFHRLACAIEDAGWEIRDCLMWLYGSGFPKSMDISKAIDKAAGNRSANITALATDAAKFWDGWGTALKPAWEPIILAMKPLEGTFSQNAQDHWVAGLNIDSTRIATTDNLGGGAYAKNPTERDKLWGEDAGNSWKRGGAGEFKQPEGRWPANVILDEEASTILDQQTADLKGGASRFFYCPKASKKEKGKNNTHPTVKPLALMEYLCTLTKTPAGGVVLDPFAGSGTTLIAARNTGRPFVGIEQEAQYIPLINERLAA